MFIPTPNKALISLCFISYLSCANAESIIIGIVNTSEPGFRSEVLSPALTHLSEAIPSASFSTVEIAAYQAQDDIKRTAPDFVIAPSDIFLQLINNAGAQALAVRQTPFAQDANQSVGSSLVVLKERGDLQTLADLRGKKVAAALPDSLGGWLALQGEMKARGLEPEDFLAQSTT